MCACFPVAVLAHRECGGYCSTADTSPKLAFDRWSCALYMHTLHHAIHVYTSAERERERETEATILLPEYSLSETAVVCCFANHNFHCDTSAITIQPHCVSRWNQHTMRIL